MTNGNRLFLSAQPVFDDVLAILPQLPGILHAEAMVEYVLDLF